ncbi:MAG: hypothetical protein PHN75_12195, partial [Syntrophales bacterium]|nr:hypothetical protein [Syntrophales bacterium]
VCYLLNEVQRAESEEEHLREIRKHGGTGRTLGPTAFVEKLESTLGSSLKRGKPGPKTKVS